MANFKLNSVLVATESGGTVTLNSAVTGIPAAGVTGTLVNAVQDNITRLGTITSGNLSHADIVYPAGHVVKTYYTGGGSSSGHTSTTSSTLNGSGILLSTNATTGTQYNIIEFSTSMQSSNGLCQIAMYKSMNGAGYVELTNNPYKMNFSPDNDYVAGTYMWVDSTGLTAGTNIYQMYHATSSGTFYSNHSGLPYTLTVRTIHN